MNNKIQSNLHESTERIVNKIFMKKKSSESLSDLMPSSSNYVSALKAKARFWKYIAFIVIIFSCITSLIREYAFRSRIYKTGVAFIYEGEGGYRHARIGTVDDDSVIAFSQDIVNWTTQFQYNDVSNFQKALTYFTPELRSVAEVQLNNRLKLWNSTKSTQYFTIKDIQILERSETAINEAIFKVKIIGRLTKYWDGQLRDSEIPDEINLKIKFGNQDINKKWHFTVLEYSRKYKDELQF